MKPTPAPWTVRTRKQDGEIVDCFVTAPDVNGFTYAAEILGDDEYRDGIERKLADAALASASHELRSACRDMLFLFDRGLPNTSIGRSVCDAAISAIEKADKVPT